MSDSCMDSTFIFQMTKYIPYNILKDTVVHRNIVNITALTEADQS